MTARQFMRYLVQMTRDAEPAWIEGSDPAVEMYDGAVRIIDQRGESCSLKHPMPRQLRALAYQLTLCAQEIERRHFEDA